MSLHENSVGDGDRASARGDGRADLDSVLADYMRRIDAGESIEQDAIVAAHPELARELRNYFSQVGEVERVVVPRERSAAPTDDEQNPTIEHRPSRKDSRGLHIRCPHCSNPVEVVSDTPYEEICCSTCGSTFSLVEREDPTRTAAPLKSIGRFDLVSRLGVGGFGTVWKAHDRELDRTVAVKIPRRGQLAPSEIDQFFREARAAAQLRHPNIVQVHEVGRDGESLFIVSDFIRGVTLTDWLTGNTINAREVAQLCIPIAEGLQHAHEQGIVHRDLKPSNIMMDKTGQPYLTDFGLAKREFGEITMTVDGQILGTPGYMSPEQASGHGHWTDRRTDVYSFGVILFQLLTGELPFRGNAQMQIHQRLVEDAPDPRKLNRHIPRDLATICLKCLEREPGRRYTSAAELANELLRFVRHEPITSRPISRTERVLRWSKRKPALASSAALIAFLAIAGPITAVVIDGQRRRLNELNLENKHVIEQQAEEHENDANRIKDLRDALDLWEGRANPWQLWPPAPAQQPRKMLMEGIVKQADRLSTMWSQGEKDQQQPFGHLALAIINDEAGRANDAIDHYQAARQLLTSLAAQHPGETQYALALADCCLQLGRLRVKSDREAASKDIGQARAIIAQLAEEHVDPRLQAGLLETELDAAIIPGFAGASQNLVRAQKIRNSFQHKVPTDPVELYQLACYLGGREAILITRKTGKGGDAK